MESREAKRAKILELKEANLSNCEIGRRVGCNESTVRGVIKRWGGSEPGSPLSPVSLKDSPRSGRPSTFTPRCVALVVLPHYGPHLLDIKEWS